MTLWQWRKRKSSLLFPILYYLIYKLLYIETFKRHCDSDGNGSPLSGKGGEILVSLREVYICISLSSIFLFEKENINCRIPTQIIVYTFPY